MPFKIPTSTTLPHYEIRCDLDGTTYALEFLWNERDTSWYLTIKTEDDEHIVTGHKIVVGIPLGARSADLRMPGGMLIALDTSGEGSQPAFDELGERVALLYYPVAEVFE